ncbi:MAG: hypothetical protein ABH807_03165 [Candidatus Shapirobacteria bacterium]
MGNKILLIIAVVILLISIPLAIILLTKPAIFNLRATGQSQPQSVSVEDITDQSALIKWTTSLPVQASLSYGLNPANLSLIYAENEGMQTLHLANLEGLLPDSDYFFALKMGGQNYSDPSYWFHTLPRQQENLPTTGPTTEPKCDTTEKLKAVLGQENPACDLNRDGIVNSVDLFLFRQQSQ